MGMLKDILESAEDVDERPRLPRQRQQFANFVVVVDG